MSEQRDCPDCGVMFGFIHMDGCDVERCAECGGQKLSCDCVESKHPRLPWNGTWPGESECIELGFYCKMVNGSWESCDKGDPEANPDLNRLYTDTVWDAAKQKRVLRPGKQKLLTGE